MDNQTCKWTAGAIVGLVGILGLFVAAHAHGGSMYAVGLIVFIVCMLIIGAMIKRHFDMQGGGAH